MFSSVKRPASRAVLYRMYSSILEGCRYLNVLRYRGERVECPFCGGRFSRFLPKGKDVPVLRENRVIGGGYRLNAVCPRCNSRDRERLVYLYLKHERSSLFSQTAKLLHIAPEKNLRMIFLSCPNLDYLAADLGSPLAEVRMDVTDIGHEDDTFDVIICNHVLEHIPDDAKAMRECFRVLKKGGFAILQVPISCAIKETLENPSITSPGDREKAFGQKDHVRIYGEDYASSLEKAGFSVTAYDFISKMNAHDVRKYGLLENEKIYLCSK